MFNHSITTISTTLAYWEAQPKFSDTVLVDAGAAQIGCSFCTIAWTRTTPAGTREDVCTCTVAFAKDPGGSLYSLLIDADKATIEGFLDTWWTAQKALTANQFTLAEYRWHDWHATESTLGPADRVTARSVAGTVGNTNRLPDQDACALTFTTASRKHWGRIYLPGIGSSKLDTATGRWLAATIDSVALNWHGLLTSLAGAGMEQVVASRAHGGLMALATLQSDDVVDIQRRRRAKQAAYHKIYTS